MGSSQLPADTLTVSLLTYEPRFDVGNEEWYVDLRIGPASVPDPFVRLGLVRYQAKAPKALQVSEPVVEWTQLLPRREATVEVTAADDGSLDIQATVIGHAAESVAEEMLTSAQSRERYNRPVMTFSLMFEGRDRDGRQTQQLLQALSTDPAIDGVPKPPSPVEGGNIEVKTVEGGTSWWAGFAPVTQARRQDLGEGTFFVTIEELEFRHPASYPGREPLTLADGVTDRTYVASGPRFFGRIDLQGTETARRADNEAANAS